MTPYLGHLAALGVAICWSATAIFFSQTGRQLSVSVVNQTHLLLALVIILLLHLIAEGEALPLDAELSRWGWLALSGVIVFVLVMGSCSRPL